MLFSKRNLLHRNYSCRPFQNFIIATQPQPYFIYQKHEQKPHPSISSHLLMHYFLLGQVMWRKYSLTKQKQVKHRPLVIFDKADMGNAVFYRVLCFHGERQLAEWLPQSFLAREHGQMLWEFNLAYGHLYCKQKEKQIEEERIIGYSIRNEKVVYTFQEKTGRIREVDSEFLCQNIQLQSQLAKFLEQQNYNDC